MSPADIARPEIRALAPYEAAIQVTDTIRLNANEAPWNPAGDRYRRPLNRYPEIRPRGLAERLAGHYGCEPRQLLVTRGSSEAIDLMVRVFCRAGVDNIVTVAPTFSMYAHYAAVQGAAAREIPADPGRDFAVDADTILAACDENTRLVFLCSPNNPTGTLLAPGLLEAVLAARAGRSIVVLDEAYIEFAGQPSATGLLAQYDNLAVLRTLSKALACAGARCGAVIADPDVIRMLDAVQAPYAFATPVVECVEDALDAVATSGAERRIREIVAERERLAAALATSPVVRRTWPSAANFILAEIDAPGRFVERCRAAGILVRRFGGTLAGCVRITVGSASENASLLQVVRSHEESADGD
ncbi:MAG: histidinol-phosphate transaminase [Woeseiaceae bacterium]|nr:histidinol-phosphate transaminase [Woeseiaceae bacterium]